MRFSEGQRQLANFTRLSCASLRNYVEDVCVLFLLALRDMIVLLVATIESLPRKERLGLHCASPDEGREAFRLSCQGEYAYLDAVSLGPYTVRQYSNH